MIPPIWLDAQGPRLPTRPCPLCGKAWTVGGDNYRYTPGQIHAATG